MLGPCWHPLGINDLPAIEEIANEAHSDLYGRLEIFAERIRLFPEGCFKVILFGEVFGYGISHPWILNKPPALDQFLIQLPDKPDCLHIHDIVVHEIARGHMARKYLKILSELSFRTLSMVAVYGTESIWSKYGFSEVQSNDLGTYGSSKYLVCPDITSIELGFL